MSTFSGEPHYAFDLSGQLVSETDANGDTASLASEAAGSGSCPTSASSCTTIREDKVGRTITLAVNAYGFAYEVIDPMGRTTSLGYDSNADLTSITDPMGGVTSFLYDSNNSNPYLVHDMLLMTKPAEQKNGQRSSTDPDNDGDSIANDTDNDFDGSTVNLYDTEGRVISQQNPDGDVTKFAYGGDPESASGSTTTITDAKGDVTVDYFSYGVLDATTTGAGTPEAATTSYVRDPDTLVPEVITYPGGRQVTNVVDTRGNVTKTTDDLGNSSLFSYNNQDQQVCAVAPEEVAKGVTCPPSPDSTPPTQAIPGATVSVYDSQGELVKKIDPMGNTSEYSYDSLGQEVCAISPKNAAAGGSCPTSPDSTPPTQAIPGATVSIYDADGNLVKTTDPAGDTSLASYDLDSEEVCSVSAHEASAGVTCPQSPTSTPPTSAIPGATVSKYDADGNQVETIDPAGGESLASYDQDGYEVCSVSAFEEAKGVSCPPEGGALPTSAISGADISIYDADGRLLSSYDGNGNKSTRTYDAIGNTLTTTDATGTTYYSYNDPAYPGETTSETTPISTTSYSYYIDGQLESKKNALGTTVSYAYDADGRLSQVTPSTTSPALSSTSKVTYSYWPDGERKSMTDATGTTSYTYDEDGRTTSVTDGAGQVTTYGYDGDSNETCLSYPMASASSNCLSSSPAGTGVVTYAYDTADRMKTMTDWLGGTTSFAYGDSDQAVTNVAFPSSSYLSVGLAHDQANRLDTETIQDNNPSVTDHTAIETFNRYQGGMISSMVEDGIFGDTAQATGSPAASTTAATLQSTSSTTTLSYSYDGGARLTQGGSDTYGYNSANQITSITRSGGTAEEFLYSSSLKPELCATYPSTTSTPACAATSGPGGVSTYAYDGIGERTGQVNFGSTTTASTYAYDGYGEMTCATDANSVLASCANPSANPTHTYTYNGDGLRMSATNNGSTEKFTWDPTTSVPRLLEDGTNAYLYGPSIYSSSDSPIEQIALSPSAPEYLIQDPTGVRAVMSSTGTLVGGAGYSAYGTCPGCALGTPFGFAGAYMDPTGLVYLVERYYDPTTGQFLTVDPAVSLTQAPYSYANDDPVNESDPLGLWGWNPISDVTQAAGDVGHFVVTHKKDIEIGAGVALGVAAAATGVGAIVEGATLTGVLLGAGSVAAGVGASALDYGACVNGHETAACVGLGLGATGVVAGGFGLAGAGLVFGGVIAEDSLTASILGGIGAFGWNVGIAGTIFDATTGFASASTLRACAP